MVKENYKEKTNPDYENIMKVSDYVDNAVAVLYNSRMANGLNSESSGGCGSQGSSGCQGSSSQGSSNCNSCAISNRVVKSEDLEKKVRKK
jgi:hypothetical protein